MSKPYAEHLARHIEAHIEKKEPLPVKSQQSVLEELRRLHAENEAFKAESAEQCRIIGSSAETELRLRTENEELKRVLVEMRQRVTELCQSYGNPLPLATFEKAEAAMKENNHG